MATVALADSPSDISSETPESSRSSLATPASVESSPSASTSVSTKKHTSILRASTSFTLPSRTNVTFAPLPPIEPRRRKSSVQLGVAARSRLLHHRRMLREHGIPPTPSNIQALQALEPPPPAPVWDHDLASPAEEIEPDDLGIDPAEQAFAAIGRFVKGASRTLFRRKSRKDGERKDVPIVHGVKDSTLDGAQEHIPEPCVGNEEGGVWEEEVGGKTWKQLREETGSAPSTPSEEVKESCVGTQTVEVPADGSPTAILAS